MSMRKVKAKAQFFTQVQFVVIAVAAVLGWAIGAFSLGAI